MRTLAPIWITSLGRNLVGLPTSMGTFRTRTPLRLPTSSTVTVPSSKRSTACLAETKRSGMRTSAPSFRPTDRTAARTGTLYNFAPQTTMMLSSPGMSYANGSPLRLAEVPTQEDTALRLHGRYHLYNQAAIVCRRVGLLENDARSVLKS